MGAVALGAVLAFLLMVVLGITGFLRVRRPAAPFEGVLELARGASEWRKVDKRWSEVAGPTPSHPPHPTLPDTYWHALPDGTWFTVKAGDCAPVLEPGQTRLPPVPRSDPAKFHYRLAGVTRLGDGTLLVASWHDEDRTSRAWRLASGASEWSETGALPIAAVSSRLVTDGAQSALLVGPGRETALHDGETWRRLPDLPGGRIGWRAALAADGSVFATGGIENPANAGRAIQYVAMAGFVAALVLAWWSLGLSPVGLVFGVALGVGAAVVAFFAIWIRIGARF